MKKGISYWSFKGGLEGTADIGAVLKEAKAHGFDSVELAAPGGALGWNVDEKTCQGLAAQAQALGIEISSVATGVYWGTSLSATQDTTRKQAIEYTRKLLQIARWLGSDAVLVVPGAVDVFFDPQSEHVAYTECYRRAQQGIRACVQTAEKLKVSICVENVWNKFLLSPLEYRDFIDSFDSRYVKSYFDTGNARLNGFPEDWIQILGKRIGRVHWKDFKFKFFGGGEQGQDGEIAGGCRKIAKGSGWAGAYSFCDLGAGDVDWPKVMAAFHKIGYQGYVTAEMLPWRADLIQQTSRDMNRILGR